MLPIDRFKTFVRQNELFHAGDRVLLAVSGGRDSVLMVHFFQDSAIPYGIAHCNFMLRDKDAIADEAFTQKLAEQFRVPYFTTRFETADYAAKLGISLQMAARKLRFDWLEQIRVQNNFQYIATAHHQNDAMETVLLNLVRGTGIAGLHGILPKRDQIIRPLLFLTREEVDSLVKAQDITYRDDASNLSSKYARNKIRLEVIPKLKELNPKLEATFEANSQRFLELELLLKNTVEELRRKLISHKNGTYYLSIPSVLELQPLHTLLFELLKPFSFTEPVIEDLIRALPGQSGLKFESISHRLVVDRHQLIIAEKDERPAEQTISLEDSQIQWGEKTFTIHTQDGNFIDLNDSPRIALVDAGKLVFPLSVRSWETGDSFCPLGMKGRKKLSDFFVGQKIPLPEKQRIPLLVNGNGEIIWIAGWRLDDRFKVTSNTEKVYIFELK